MYLLFYYMVKKNYKGDNYVDDNEIMDGMLNVNIGIIIVIFNEKIFIVEFLIYIKVFLFVLLFKLI